MSDEIEKVEETTEIVDGVHNYSAEDEYVHSTEPAVLEQLEWFRDQKIGLMMHWGPYCQIGVVESWALSDKDADWSRTHIDWTDGEGFKAQYFGLNKTFNPVRFTPKTWAKAAKDAGFRYLTFTTKHHDGFCMWDTQYSDYKITAEDCPFHENEKADICKHLFDAFRAEGLAISAYFSKADWHSPHYWRKQDGNFTKRGPSYDTFAEPAEWEKFVVFTQNQIRELCDKYGRIDMLWFDAGWVCPQAKQDIRMDELIDGIRKSYPWMLSADRTVGGKYENVITPEQCIPPSPISVPWESNLTMGTSYSFKYEDEYKSPRTIICTLMDIVAKGGNLALNVGPQPDGRLPAGALNTMKGMGEWLNKYGEAVYGTRPCAPYKKDSFAFTQKGNKVYALRMFEGENEKMPEELVIPYTDGFSKVTLLNVGEITTEKVENGIAVTLHNPDSQNAPIALVFAIEK